jgi:hypothetical protein
MLKLPRYGPAWARMGPAQIRMGSAWARMGPTILYLMGYGLWELGTGAGEWEWGGGYKGVLGEFCVFNGHFRQYFQNLHHFLYGFLVERGPYRALSLGVRSS